MENDEASNPVAIRLLGPDAMTARAWAVQGTVTPNASLHPPRAGGRRPPAPAGNSSVRHLR
jgi:hypothetical protein